MRELPPEVALSQSLKYLFFEENVTCIVVGATIHDYVMSRFDRSRAMKSTLYPLLLCTGGLLIGASAAAADKVSYSFAEVSYVYSQADLGPVFGTIDGDGGRIEFSAEVVDNFYLLGGFETLELDSSLIAPLDVETWSAGAGWHTDLGSGTTTRGGYRRDRWSFFAEAQYQSLDVTGASGNTDGFSVDLGFRGVNHTNFEFIGSVGYLEYEDADGDVTVEGRLLYKFSDNFGVTFGASWLEDFARGFIGVRYNFNDYTQ